jgi:RimK family alpha-L-glutamate ligase
MRIGIVARRASMTNVCLAASAPRGVHAFLVSPEDALRELGPGDLALGRLDVRPTLDGVEQGLDCLDRLASRGVPVLNSSLALRLAHDKLATSIALGAANLPHPRTHLVDRRGPAPLPFPLVLKPRYGSWGRDVTLCEDAETYDAVLASFETRAWFRTAGAVAQELVPPLGHDIRLVVAAGEVVGAVRRVAAAGEWRTNVALGAHREPVEPSPVACELAVAAAEAIGAQLAGVDLLPLGPGRDVVIEVNGAVDFNETYRPGREVYEEAMRALVRAAGASVLLPDAAEAGGW